MDLVLGRLVAGMREVFEGGQQLIRYDDAGMTDPHQLLLAATGWLLQAARDVDAVARSGPWLGHVAGAIATSSRDLLGYAFENAVADLLTVGQALLPELAKAVALTAHYGGMDADFSEPRVIAIVADRPHGSFLRASYEDVASLVSDDAVVLTPAAGRPVRLWSSSQDRLRDLLEASTSSRPPASLTPTVAKLHHADVLLGSVDGRHWIGVDLKSGSGRCIRTNPGIHLGISEDASRGIFESQYDIELGQVPRRGQVPTFIELHLGTLGTPLGRIRDAIDLMPALAALRRGTDTHNARRPEASRAVLAQLQPLVEEPLDAVIRELLPWSSRATDTLYVPTIGFNPDPPSEVTTRLV